MGDEVKQIYSWPVDATAIVLRYFLIAGASYLLFYVWKRRTFFKLKIQKIYPPRKTVLSEIAHSISTLTIYCVSSRLVFRGYERGLTKIYPHIVEYGYAYFFVSIVIMVVIHDTYFYWTHRLMHTSRVFGWAHQTHHLSHNPTPWAAFSFHPLEAIISIGIIPIIVFLIPCHPYALFAFLTFMTLINVTGHLGYEVFTQKFIKSKLGRWQNTSTNHNIHHQLANYNFGLYFTFWDKVMKTYSDK